LVGDKIVNHSKPTLGVINAPSVQGGSERSRGQDGRIPTSLPRHRLAQVGSWMGMGPCYVGACSGFARWMGRLLVFWCMIYITLYLMAYFDYNSLVFMYVTCKTSGAMSIVRVYVCKNM